MNRISYSILIISIVITSSVCSPAEKPPMPGAFQTGLYEGLLEGKSVAVVANQTSRLGQIHLVDTLLASGINIKVIFAPEHGFRNQANAGERIENSKDPETGIHIISLYGKHLKPTPGRFSRDRCGII